MKNSDYIVKCLVESKVTDVFGYPGAVICHFIDSASKNNEMDTHLNYHEQASAFAACGYGLCGKIGVAYSNGGPGATNLYTGIVNAWYDSIPSIFLIGQGDLNSLKGKLPIKQKGIQEIPVAQLMKQISKESVRIDKAEELPYYIERALYQSNHGRPGPIVLELPADIQRSNINLETCKHYIIPNKQPKLIKKSQIIDIIHIIKQSKRPCLLIGNGVKFSKTEESLRELINNTHIPTVFSLPAMDTLPFDHPYNFGFIGNNGFRYSNMILSHSDCIIALGTRLDLKQVGLDRNNFVPNATLIRVDIDKKELTYKVHENEIQICADLREALPLLSKNIKYTTSERWINTCIQLKKVLYGYDFKSYHRLIQKICDNAHASTFTADVGQHQIHIAQAIKIKPGQRLLLSLGLASMGFSLPAAIGAYYATKKPVICFSGDGGIQMNIQELETIKRDHLPIKVIIINNNSLGMIREFQQRNFESKYYQSVPSEKYTIPNFKKISEAYGIPYRLIRTIDEIEQNIVVDGPEVIEVLINEFTYLYPRFIRGKDIKEMDPPLTEAIRAKIDLIMGETYE